MDDKLRERVIQWNAGTTIRQGQNNRHDSEGFVSLFNGTYDRKIDEDYYHWQFFERPANLNRVVLAERSGEIVGCYGYQMTSLSRGSQSIPIALTSDQIVIESHKGRGLPYLLEDEIEQLCISAGASAMYATPNEAGLSVKLATEWSSYQTVKTWRLPELSAEHRTNVSVREISNFQSSAPQTVEGFMSFPEAPIAFSRNNSWGEWRFRKPVGSKYRTFEMTVSERPFGYVTAKLFPSTAVIDLIDFRWTLDAPQLAGYMLQNVAKIMAGGDFKGAIAWASDDTLSAKALAAAQFTVDDVNSRILCVKWIEDEIDRAPFADSPWTLTMADSDMF